MVWKKIEPPKKKADYRYKYLCLLASPPPSKYDWANGRLYPPLPVQPGDVAQIHMRRDYREIEQIVGHNLEQTYGKRVLELRWKCPHCDHAHEVFIPESWLAEGKAEFVEAEE